MRLKNLKCKRTKLDEVVNLLPSPNDGTDDECSMVNYLIND